MEEKPTVLHGKIYISWTVDLDVHLRQGCLNALCLTCREKQYVDDTTKLNSSANTIRSSFFCGYDEKMLYDMALNFKNNGKQEI